MRSLSIKVRPGWYEITWNIMQLLAINQGSVNTSKIYNRRDNKKAAKLPPECQMSKKLWLHSDDRLKNILLRHSIWKEKAKIWCHKVVVKNKFLPVKKRTTIWKIMTKKIPSLTISKINNKCKLQSWQTWYMSTRRKCRDLADWLYHQHHRHCKNLKQNRHHHWHMAARYPEQQLCHSSR